MHVSYGAPKPLLLSNDNADNGWFRGGHPDHTPIFNQQRRFFKLLAIDQSSRFPGLHIKRDLRMQPTNHSSSIRDEELRKRLRIESIDKITLDRRRMNWMEKVAKIPATLDDCHVNTTWCLVLRGKLQFDTNDTSDDSALCGSHDTTLRNR